jgi:hypothetical protein
VAGSHTPAAKPTGWVGWIVFTAAMMVILGLFNVINGLAAIFADDLFVTGPGGPIVLDVTAWGWVHFLVGLAVATAGAFLLQGATWARIVAICAVMVNLVAQVLFLPAYPAWSMLIIAVDVLVLWALIVHGEEQIA